MQQKLLWDGTFWDYSVELTKCEGPDDLSQSLWGKTFDFGGNKPNLHGRCSLQV